MFPVCGNRLNARMLFGLVSPRVVSAVTGGPYHGMPSVVLIARWPPWRLAAVPGGQMPRVPAWMCMAWAAGSSSPDVCTVTVASVPSRWTSASPMPLTWFVGTGARSLASGTPGGGLAADRLALPLPELDDAFEPESEDPSVITATGIATIASTRNAIAALRHRRPPPEPADPGPLPLPSGGPEPTGTGTGGAAAGGAGGAAAGDAGASSRVALWSAAVSGSAATPERSPRVTESASSSPAFVGCAASAERRRSWAAIAALTAADSSPAVA